MNFMEEALIEAQKAASMGEVPVGAVIVKDNVIIGRGFNKKETLNSVIAHAEIMAIQEACKNLNNWRLNGCEMYVTLEPCPMCAGAILQSRISKIHIGAKEFKSGACGSAINLMYDDNLNKFLDIDWQQDDRCFNILKEFFKKRREDKKK